MMIPAELVYALLFVFAMSVGVYFAVRLAIDASLQKYQKGKDNKKDER